MTNTKLQTTNYKLQRNLTANYNHNDGITNYIIKLPITKNRIANCKLQTTEPSYELQTTNYRNQTTNYKLNIQNTNYKTRITNYKDQIPNYKKLSITNYKNQTTNYKTKLQTTKANYKL